MRSAIIRGKDDLGHAIRRRRREIGWTQDELAARSGLAAKHVSRIENGLLEVRLSTVLALAAALGLDLSVTRRFGGDASDSPPASAEPSGTGNPPAVEDIF